MTGGDTIKQSPAFYVAKPLGVRVFYDMGEVTRKALRAGETTQPRCTAREDTFGVAAQVWKFDDGTVVR